jgi:hypothetical protein
MHLPYTDNYEEVVSVAASAVAASLTAVLWSRPWPRRFSNALFIGGVWATAAFAEATAIRKTLGLGAVDPLLWLQLCSCLVTLAIFRSGPRSLAVLSLGAQGALWLLGTWVRGSNHELMFAHLLSYGALLGAHALRATPAGAGRPAQRLAYPKQDVVIFVATFALATFVMTQVFEGVVYNGDEVANTFQANVYGHFRAYAPVPPCASAFENYWVFRYQGRVFSQYTPGWPLFMAPFERLGVPSLAGPVMAGIAAVGIARLSRRLASGFGSTLEGAARIVSFAGPLGAASALLGPSMLLNGASRFSHTMVTACFAWAVESAAALATQGATRGQCLRVGLLLGAATSLGLATRPADGGFLGIGVFLYFVRALWLRRISAAGFLGTALGFLFFGGLTAVILRLQVGEWFKTAYAVTPLFHPEGELVLTFPKPSELKYGIPLATGSYVWWPAAAALGAVGMVRALAGRERRIVFMLVVSTLCLFGFYSLVVFGRGGDDGLGPRYVLPSVVAQAAGTAAALAPLFARWLEAVRHGLPRSWRPWHAVGPALLASASAVYGVWRIAPRTYPVAYAEHHSATAPLRGAREQRLKNAVVFIIPNNTTNAGWSNLTQNPPLDPNPDVLFLALRNPGRDEACVRKHFPGRKWYRAGPTERLVPY